MAKGALLLNFAEAVLLAGSLMACMSASGECGKGQRSRDVHNSVDAAYSGCLAIVPEGGLCCPCHDPSLCCAQKVTVIVSDTYQ